MTAPSPRDPWLLPTDQQFTVSPGRGKRRPLSVIALSVVAIVALCCGGLWTIGTVAGPGKSKAAGDAAPATPDDHPLLVVPSTTSASPSTSPTPPMPSPTAAEPTTAAARPATKRKPAVTRKPVVKPEPTTRNPTPTPSTTTQPVRVGVRPGAFCSPRGAYGLTRSGTLMVCKPSVTDSRNRWRRAVASLGQTG